MEAPADDMVFREAIIKMAGDLAWTGPNGKLLRYVVLEREQAKAVIFKLKELTR